ncbi:MAG: hydroxymethylglutaryl-CoA synthase family protein [Myxococcales bacterium]|nr:hydroxymethylglutaryl-CoA synthase family protein [Myxococcales bacterium]
MREFGVSGAKVYVPRLRVDLKRWCDWTDNNWSKTEAVVGRSFRMKAPHESIYTMAANAVLRLIVDYDIDPAEVGYLALGTESSTDNSAGAVIVRGMVDQGLRALGHPTLARHVEVPELKHACLGGIYALKSAVRYLAYDGAGRKAIVVCGDVAEYERGSSGEPTQGAGTVAMLVEERPKLFGLDLDHAGSASAYRGPDFRKPFVRHFLERGDGAVAKLHDFPVFSGRYSTVCYTEATIRAVEDMLVRLRVTARNLYHGVGGIFMHRPYRRMPDNAMSSLYIWGLSRSEAHLPELRDLCAGAGVDSDKVLREIASRPDLYDHALSGDNGEDVFRETMQVVRHFRTTDKFKEIVSHKMALGSERMMDLGNLYSAALPVWIAAGFDEAQQRGLDIARQQFLAIGYGSGDAAEAIPIWAADNWQAAARRVDIGKALEGAIDLTREQYQLLHDEGRLEGVDYQPSGEFVIDRLGGRKETEFQDLGIEYYSYAP